MFTDIDHLPLAEPCGHVMTVYADTNSGIEILPPGVNARTTYVEAQRLSGIWYRVPILFVIRPVISFNSKRWDIMFEQAKTGDRVLALAN